MFLWVYLKVFVYEYMCVGVECFPMGVCAGVGVKYTYMCISVWRLEVNLW